MLGPGCVRETVAVGATRWLQAGRMDLTRYDDKALALLSSIQQDIAAMRWTRAWTAPASRREAEQALRRARALRREINRRKHKG